MRDPLPPAGSERPPVSVVINTLDRADSLRATLRSLRHIRYPTFEVIVVDGPSTDHTPEVLAEFEGAIKVRHCPEANLSRSRNIGIASAATDLVAFIDDDAIPEPQWLDDLVSLHDLSTVAASGGLVIGHTGYALQCHFNSADRLGNARYDHTVPMDDMCFPGAERFPYVPGGNALWWRTPLIEVGGFDEEYEYYLDEVDVCARLVEEGWRLRQHPRGAIHHKFLASSLRGKDRILLNRYPVIKNKIYFSMVNGGRYESAATIFADNAAFSEMHTDDLRHWDDLGRIEPDDLAEALATIERGWTDGIAAGERGRVALYDAEALAHHAEPFLQFPVIPAPDRRFRVAFLTQTLPPDPIGGIGRYMLDLGRELGRRGHEVRIITTGTSHDTMDFEDGVWVHRLVKDGVDAPPPELPPVPPGIWANASRVAKDVEDTARFDRLDAVYSAMWDVESAGVPARTATPNLVALVTTLAITLRTRPEWLGDPDFMERLGGPLVDLEAHSLRTATGIHAISRAILDEVQETSGVTIPASRRFVGHLGTEDRFPDAAPKPPGDGCHVLFVGRYEKRKGIDALLGAVPRLMESSPNLTMELIGKDDLPGEHGVPYLQEFLEQHRGAPWLDRIQFRGEVDDDELVAAYERCDVFVAPSRFESFGLIYLEAMAAARPVVAARAGAAVEVLEDGGGVLVAPGDADALAEAILTLALDADLRHRLAVEGRKRFLERFTVAAMADRFLELLSLVEHVRADDQRVRLTPAGSEAIGPDGSPLAVVAPGSSATLEWQGGELGAGRPVLHLHLQPRFGERAVLTVRAGSWSEVVEVSDRAQFRQVALPPGSRSAVLEAGPQGRVALAAWTNFAGEVP